MATKDERTLTATVVLMLIALWTLVIILLSGCTNSDKAREAMRKESEDNYGIMRTVTAYSVSGEQLGQWHGMIDVQYTDNDYNMQRVDLVIFDGDKPVDRVILSGCSVIVDND